MSNSNEKLIFFWKGRVALYAILKAIGIGPGDEVILPGFTCVVVPNAISYLRAKPVYIDIDPKSFNIDPDKIEDQKGKSWHPGKAKAIIAQHTFGIPAEMNRIIDTANKHDLFTVEDSCHAIGSKYKNLEVGSIGDAAFFSSQWSKPVTTGLGGWAKFNKIELKKKAKSIVAEFKKPAFKEEQIIKLQHFMYSRLFRPSTYWFLQETYRTLGKHGIAIGSSSPEELDCKLPKDYEKKMSNWQKILLNKKIERINKVLEHRKWITSVYEEKLMGKRIETVELPEYSEPIFLRYPVIVKNKWEILEKAKRSRIEIGDWFVSPIHPNLDGWEKLGYSKGICPIAEKICNQVINLPTHTGIDEQEAGRIVGFVAENIMNYD